MAQGAAILSRWASKLVENNAPIIDFTVEAERWQAIANEFTVKTRQMWHDGWFRDYDSVASEWLDERNAMHFAPVFCGVAGWCHIERLGPALAQPPSNNPHWRPLSWPPS